MNKGTQTIISILFLLCGVCGSPLLSAQKTAFWNLTMDDGLSFYPSSRSGPILQDRRGFIWIATDDGLNRFDGREFRVFRMSSGKKGSLGNNFVIALCEDLDGNIWAGTIKGISVFDPRTENFSYFRHDPEDPKSLCSDEVNFLARDLEGNIWVGTRFAGVCYYSWKQKHFIRVSFDHTGSTIIYDGQSFHQRKDSSIWIGNANGLYSLDRGKKSFERYLPYPEENSWRFNGIVNIMEDRRGIFWLTSGTSFGRRLFDPATLSFQDIPVELALDKDNALNSFLEDREGNIWIGANNGVIKWEPQERRSRHYLPDEKDPGSILSGPIIKIFEDWEGNIWFLAGWTGFSVLKDLDNPFETCTDFPVQAMAKLDEHRVFLGSTEGVQVYDLQQKKVVPYDLPAPIRSADVLRMTTSSHQELWVVDQRIGKMFSYHLTDKELRTSVKLSPLTEDLNKRLWTSHKLLRYNRAAGKWDDVYEQLKKKDPRNTVEAIDFKCIATDSSGNIWIGTDGFGLYKYDQEQEALYTALRGLEPLRELSDAIITGLHVGSNGWIYAATTYGLSVYDPVQKKLTILDDSDGLPHRKIMAIAEDRKGDIWLATIRGIVRLNITNWQITNFGKDDGLSDDKFVENVSYVDAEGYIYFSTAKELIRFHPDRLTADGAVAPVYLTRFFINHQPVDPGGTDSLLQVVVEHTESIVLSHKQSNFGFEFVMPVFKNPTKVKYFYRLEGYDTKWNAAGNQNQAFYTNIDPGTYTFRAKAVNNAGQPGLTEAAVLLTINPPWWATWWAYSLYILAMLSLVYILFNRQQLKYKLNLETLETEKLREVDQLKSRFFANISHEFRTPLTLILGQIDSLKATINDQRQRGKLKVADRNARRLLELISQLLDLSKLEAGAMALKTEERDLASFLKNIFFSMEPMMEEKKLSLHFHSDKERLPVYFDTDKLEKVFSNLLSNAYKFTPAGGAISISIEEADQEWVTVKVTDTGQGIPAAALPYLFDRFYQVDGSYTRRQGGTGIGLALVKELVELHRGQVSVQSQPGKGSTFTVQLRQGRAHLRAHEITGTEGRSKQDEAAPVLTGLPVEEDRSPAYSKIGRAETSPGGASVLVVEDNPDVRLFIANSLREEHYHVLEAADGKEGLEKAREALPDLIITDVMMPEMDGYEFSRLIRGEVTTSHIPIIILTAKVEEDEKIYGLQLGVDDYLTKPFSPRELLIRVGNLITLRRQLRQRFSHSTVFDPGEVSASSMDQVFLKSVMQIIEKNLGDVGFGAEQLAEKSHISVGHLNRKLNALIDQPAGRLIRSTRLQRAAQMLANRAGTVTEIGFQFGFSDASNFSRSFKNEFGCSPSEYMEKMNQQDTE